MKKSMIVAALLVPALAFAEPKTPDDWYKEGETQYRLGNFDAAIAAFKKGFELETNPTKRPAYLSNIAQSYKDANNCKDALFFEKGYLALRSEDKSRPLTDKRRAEIEKTIDQYDACAKEQEAAKPPEKPPEPAKPVVVAAVTPVPHDEPVIAKVAEEPPHLISLRLLGGGAKISTGSVSPSIQPSVGLLAGYPLAVGESLTLDLGAAFLYQPVPFDAGTGMTGSATMISVLADVGATFAVVPRVGIRGDLGLGALVFSGVSRSPFTAGRETTGALSMFEVRAALTIDIKVTPNVLVAITPIAFSYSPPKAGLLDDIKSITRLELMLGVGYRM